MKKTAKKLVTAALAAGILFNTTTIPFLPDFIKQINQLINPVAKITVIATGYSSTIQQTDDTPFITASNAHVRDGIVAANFLPFGTEIAIPELYQDKIFVIEDRMHRRFTKAKIPRIDIWFSTLAMAKKFGVKTLEIEVKPQSDGARAF